MTIYNINLGIGWASSGVEYAQAYRAKVFKQLGMSAKFIFTDFFSQDNLLDLTRNLGFCDDDIIWLYHAFTDLPLTETTYTLDQLKASFFGELTKTEQQGKIVRFFYEKDQIFLAAYLKDEASEIVHRVEYVSRGKLIRKDYFMSQKFLTEFYAPKDNKATLYQRRFFNQDGSVAYDEFIDESSSIFKLPEGIFYSKETFVAHFMKTLQLTEQDVVILDRATGIGQAVFRTVKPAKLGVIIHAEHFSQNATTEQTILWNNYYEYQFSQADKVDFFVTATEKQKELLTEQFAKYHSKFPNIVTIPVGSIDVLAYPSKPRQAYSMITASRLADEKHVDWLVRAAILAKKDIPNLTFDIYGEGGARHKLQQLINNADVGSAIRLKGHQNLQTTYQHYELYVSASKSEGFGLTLLEAVGSGLPIIGFDAPYGNQTFIKQKENGYLLPKEEHDENEIVDRFAKAIVQFFTNADREKMQEKSYQVAKAYLTSQVESKWKNIIEEVTKG